MKPWVGFMNWDIPNPTCGERAPRAHTPSTDASFTYHTVSLTPKPEKPNTVDLPGRLRSGAGAGIFHKTRHLLQPALQQHTSWPRLSALTSILNTSMRL